MYLFIWFLGSSKDRTSIYTTVVVGSSTLVFLLDFVYCLINVAIFYWYSHQFICRFGMLHAVKGLEPWRVIDYGLGPWPGVHQCCLLAAGIRAFFNAIYEHKKTLLVNSLDTSQRLDSPTFAHTDLTFWSTILCCLLWASVEVSFFLSILLHSVNASRGHLL